MNMGKNCDICWDDLKQEVPAFEFISGVPMCHIHVAEMREAKKKKMNTTLEREQEPDVIQVVDPQLDALARKKIRKSAAVANRGVRTAKDFAELMTALMDDLLAGSVDMGTASAVCSAGDRLLRVAEMQIRYQPRNNKPLLLGAPQEQQEPYTRR